MLDFSIWQIKNTKLEGCHNAPAIWLLNKKQMCTETELNTGQKDYKNKLGIF